MTKNLTELIKLAQGARTQNAFSAQCGINSATITRILTEKRNPTPRILRKIADHAENGVTYEELMRAAGHLDSNQKDFDQVVATLFGFDGKSANVHFTQEQAQLLKTMIDDRVRRDDEDDAKR